MRQGENASNAVIAAIAQAYETTGMADRLELVQRLIWDECRKRKRTPVGKGKRKLMIGNPPYPNASALGELIGTDKGNAWRLIWAQRNVKPADARKRPSRRVREFQLSHEVRQGICNWLGIGLEDLDARILDAPPLPDHPRLRSLRRASHRNG